MHIFLNPELSSMQQKVVPGIDSFLETIDYDKTLRYALVTNNAALTNDGILSREALVKKEFNLVKIFSPEHGISVKGIDGAIQYDETDEATGLPIISLYGDRLSPTEEDLADVDIVLFDIPDVGCRFYTYLWTMTYVMEACAAFNKPFIVLDRPNPIGGDIAMIEGPMLDEENCSSFIGRWSIPVRHSCTMGELALYFSQKKINGLDLKVIPVQNWGRDQMAGTPSFEFYPTSPAITDLTTAFVYPGIGLLEGIDVNEGRGTDKPFLRFGAPWINAEKLHEQLLDKVFFGIKTRPCAFIPEDGLYKGQECHGLELVITDEKTFYPVSFGIKLMSLLVELYPNHVKERAYRTSANPSGSGHLDKLIGIKNSFELLKSGSSIDTDVSASWSSQMAPFYLYS
jgi:uncharacterized protein YbbC (DUF1343 family)